MGLVKIDLTSCFAEFLLVSAKDDYVATLGMVKKYYTSCLVYFFTNQRYAWNGNFSSGKKGVVVEDYKRLEIEFGAWEGCNNPNTVACASGSAALHLALEALRHTKLSDGDLVIVPNYTMIACARAVTMAGLKPVFVDCGSDLLISLAAIHEALARHEDEIKAIMPVHIYGRRCDMDRIISLANNYDLAVVEDLSEAHGIQPHPDSDAACWSFYRNKIVAGEEGGMIAFKNAQDADMARTLRCMGMVPGTNCCVPRGENARMTNSHARLILDSLADVSVNTAARSATAVWYDIALANTGLPDGWKMPPREVCWVYDVRLPEVNTEHLEAVLCNRGVEARAGFAQLTNQPEYLGHSSIVVKELISHARWRSRGRYDIICLPIKPTMSRSDVNTTVQILQRVVGRHTAAISG